MNLKIRSLLLQLEAIEEADLLMCTRSDLVDLSNALFAVLGATEAELDHRCGYDRPREQFEVN
jgi:hypothetical protein